MCRVQDPCPLSQGQYHAKEFQGKNSKFTNCLGNFYTSDCCLFNLYTIHDHIYVQV